MTICYQHILFLLAISSVLLLVLYDAHNSFYSVPNSSMLAHSAPAPTAQELEADWGTRAKLTSGLPRTFKPHKTIVIWSLPRSGSSFTVDLVSKIPGSFTVYEPINSKFHGKSIVPNETNEALQQTLKQILSCDFDFSMNFVDELDPDFCITNPNEGILCNLPLFLSYMCSRSRAIVLKTVALRLKHGLKQLQDDPGLDIKIVHLVRDPRAILTSARRVPFDEESGLKNQSVICALLREDLAAGDVLAREFPEKYLRLQYEDLASSPIRKMKEILQFLNEKFTARLLTHFRKHTSAFTDVTAHEFFSTRKLTKSLPFTWRHRANFSDIAEIQDSCADVIQKMKLRIFQSEQEYRNLSLNVRL